MATISNVICACALVFLLLFVGLSQQRTVSGEESRFLMRQPRIEQERLFRPPALLADLQVPEGQLHPPFSSMNFSYIVIVPKDVQDVHIKAKMALGKENDRFRIRITSSNLEVDMDGSTMVLRRNASTIYVKVHVSSHRLKTCTYLLKIVSGPDDTPHSHGPTGGVDGSPKAFWKALFNILMFFGGALAVGSVAVFLYGTLETLRSRTNALEDYQPISGRP